MKNLIVVGTIVMLGACGDDGGGGKTLWLVPNGSELAVKLVTETPTSTY
jgi:hypothetical protein